jgi:hypothetical protein
MPAAWPSLASSFLLYVIIIMGYLSLRKGANIDIRVLFNGTIY